MWNHFSFLQLPLLSSRAVQLGSLYVRGLSHLLGANCASGGPLPRAALMPWHSFDGRLFHLKYLLAHRGVEKAVLLESDVSVNRLTKKGRFVRSCLCSDLLVLCGLNAEEFSPIPSCPVVFVLVSLSERETNRNLQEARKNPGVQTQQTRARSENHTGNQFHRKIHRLVTVTVQVSLLQK